MKCLPLPALLLVFTGLKVGLATCSMSSQSGLARRLHSEDMRLQSKWIHKLTDFPYETHANAKRNEATHIGRDRIRQWMDIWRHFNLRVVLLINWHSGSHSNSCSLEEGRGCLVTSSVVRERPRHIVNGLRNKCQGTQKCSLLNRASPWFDIAVVVELEPRLNDW